MRKSLILVSIIALLVACQSAKDKSLQNINTLEKKLHDNPAMVMDKTFVRELTLAYSEFSEKFSEDTLAAEYLFRAGEIANGIMLPNDAINYFKKVYEKYPAHNKAATALFLQGFVYETQLKNIEKAKVIYIEFLTKYPQHKLAKDVQFSLDNLGKSDEELIKMFNKKNQTP